MASTKTIEGRPAAKLTLLQSPANTDTIEVLEHLLDLARKGEVIGFAFAAMLRRRAYLVDTASECRGCPTFTRGMLQALDAEIASRLN